MSEERRAGVLGHPISHSLSPVLHRAAYGALGLDWTYDAHDVTEERLGDFLQGLDSSWAGLSLTMPLKVAAIPFLDTIEPVAAILGVVNTVIVKPEGDGIHLDGANTDIYGVRQALSEAGIANSAKPVILGSGATSTSAMAALHSMGIPAPVVVAKNWEETEGFAEAASRLGISPEIVFTPDAPAVMADASVVISTIPMEVGAMIGASLSAVQAEAILLDAVYDPLVTPLAEAWERAGGRAVNGTRMLLHQAAEQVRMMTGRPAPLEAMDAALVSHISR